VEKAVSWSNYIDITTMGPVRFQGIEDMANELDYPYVVNGAVLFRDDGKGGLQILDLCEMDDDDDPAYGDSGGTIIARGSVDAQGLQVFADHLVSGRLVIKQQYEDPADPPTLFIVEPGRVAEIKIGSLVEKLAKQGVDEPLRPIVATSPTDEAETKLTFPSGPQI
jgi:hypothetical protein